MKTLHDFLSFFALPIHGIAADAGTGGGGAAGTGTAAPTAGDGTAAAAGGGTGTAAGAGAAAGAGTAAGTASPSGPLIGADGKFVAGWSKQLGGTDALEAKFTEPKALVGSYLSLEKLISAKGIIPPGPNATADERAAFHKALGRPDKPEDYGVGKAPDKLGDQPFPKELWDQARADGFQKVAHEIGLTKEQAAKLAEFDMTTGLARLGKFNEVQQQAREQAETALKTEWGAKFGENLALAKKAAEQAGGADLLAHPLANDPVFIKAMAKVGAMIVETPAAGARGTQAGASGGDPSAQIAAMMNDKNHAWQPDFAKKGHSAAAHEAAVREMQRLFALKHPAAA